MTREDVIRLAREVAIAVSEQANAVAVEMVEQALIDLEAASIGGKYVRLQDARLSLPREVAERVASIYDQLPQAMADAVPDDAPDADDLRREMYEIGRTLCNNSISELKVRMANDLTHN
jgi:hypothetical protein